MVELWSRPTTLITPKGVAANNYVVLMMPPGMHGFTPKIIKVCMCQCVHGHARIKNNILNLGVQTSCAVVLVTS